MLDNDAMIAAEDQRMLMNHLNVKSVTYLVCCCHWIVILIPSTLDVVLKFVVGHV